MKDKGFSLLELVVVMAIIGFIAFLIPPLMSSTIENLKTRTTAKNIAASLRYARNKSISEKIPFGFYLNTKERVYWLTSKLSAKDQKAATPLKLDIKKQFPKDIDVLGIKNIPDNNNATKTYAESSEEKDDSFFSIKFFPEGTSEGGKIIIRKKQKAATEKLENRYYEIVVDIFTGKIDLEELPKEL